MNTERFCEIVQDEQREIDMAVFDLAQIGLRQTGDLARILLIPAPFAPKSGGVSSDKDANVHDEACRTFGRASLFAQTNMLS